MKVSHIALVLLAPFATLSLATAQSLTQRIQKAQATAASLSNDCSGLRSPGFYWEIGDANGIEHDPIAGDAGGTVGGDATHGWPKRDEPPMSIASASKWVWAAYFVQRYGAASLTSRDIEFLTLSSGYHSLTTDCGHGAADTVDDCLALCSEIGPLRCNDVFSNDAGEFYYDSAHFEAQAGSLNLFTSSYHHPGLGPDGNAALAVALNGVLSPGASWITFTQPVLAGGIRTTPGSYIDYFLAKILTQNLQIASLLGSHPVCTTTHLDANNNPICPSSEFEPPSVYDLGVAWHYSLGHWVEDDPTVGDDGAFSSGGSRGFYPWIWIPQPGNPYNWTTPIYGVVARDTSPTGSDPTDPDAIGVPEVNIAESSMKCGRAIRKAFELGVAQ